MPEYFNSTEPKELHTVIGASGAVGKALIAELKNLSRPIRAVSRSLQLEGVETVAADALSKDEIYRAISGSSHVYLCLGLPYDTRVWRRDWPIVMQNVLGACIAYDARLIFLDNIYSYGPTPLQVPFDERHTQKPPSKKGQVRKQVLDFLSVAMKENRLQAVIGRAADFYGPHANNSLFYISYLDRMLEGKAPQSIGSPGIKHTYTNVSDVGRALVALALSPDTYGQAWHLPVGPPITIEEMTELFNQALGTSHKVSFLPPFMRILLSLFIKPLREMKEMMYQFEEEYQMSWEKFRTQFPDFKVSTYEQGIREMIDSFQEK